MNNPQKNRFLFTVTDFLPHDGFREHPVLLGCKDRKSVKGLERNGSRFYDFIAK